MLAQLWQRPLDSLFAVNLAKKNVIDVLESVVVEPIEDVHAGFEIQFCHVRVLLDLEAGQFVQSIPQESKFYRIPIRRDH